MHIGQLSNKASLLPLLLSLLLAGCAGASATVVSSEGPGIKQAQAEPTNGPKLRVAVSSFEFRSRPGVGAGMADMLTAALFNTNKFIVLERDRLDDVKAEQDLAATGRFDNSTVAPSGQLEGAQLLVRAAVTQFEPNCSGASVIVASTKEACIALNLRIVDVATGRIVNATTVEANSRNSGVGIVFAGGDLPVGLGAYRNTPMEQAIRLAIDTAVKYIAQTKL